MLKQAGRVAVRPTVGLALVAMILLLAGCGSGDPDTTQASPEGWTRIWSSPADTESDIVHEVIDVPAGFVRIVIEQTDPTEQWDLDIQLAPDDPAAAPWLTVPVLDKTAKPVVSREGALTREVRTVGDIHGGKYILEYYGTGRLDVTVHVSR